ncbi:MAG: DNA-processing protein DprA [Betaproteobacteria bacterium]|nr:DNA-processing protein DprA [Betaproteobacteria bacterium]
MNPCPPPNTPPLTEQPSLFVNRSALGNHPPSCSASVSPCPPLCLRSHLHLALTPGLGAGSARRLCEALGCACAVLAAPDPALQAHLSNPVALALGACDNARTRAVERAIEWGQAPGQHLLVRADPRYPASLASLPDPPMVLYVRGTPSALAQPAVALVGSRNASRDGLEMAHVVAGVFARAGLVVVSGLAAGIDSAAHRGALDAGGLTVGFVGTGADLIYPRTHRALAQSVVGQGALISELPLGSPAAAHHFPRRNRLIAAQAVAVVVVQAARHSGSLITARFAAELGREVAAFPGSVHSPLSHGCHQLIREGAALVEDAADIAALVRGALERAGWLVPSAPLAGHPTPPSAVPVAHPSMRRLLKALGWGPVAPEALARAAGLSASDAAAALLDLELAGHIERLIDGRFQRLAKPAAVGQPEGPFPQPGPVSLLASSADRPV